MAQEAAVGSGGDVAEGVEAEVELLCHALLSATVDAAEAGFARRACAYLTLRRRSPPGQYGDDSQVRKRAGW
jgi:hypothetical protein